MGLIKRTAIITKENIRRLRHLYGDMADLSEIVNHHLKITTDGQECTSEHCGSQDMIQMNTYISLTDKDGKFIEVKVPEPEYITDPMW